jgi:hypothetical protein
VENTMNDENIRRDIYTHNNNNKKKKIQCEEQPTVEDFKNM